MMTIENSPRAAIGSPTAVTDADQRIRVFWRAGSIGHHAVQPADYGTVYGTRAPHTGRSSKHP
jgi:hypothetical protein